MQLELMTDEMEQLLLWMAMIWICSGLAQRRLYVASVTNKRYEVLSKKVMGEPEGELPQLV